MLQERVGDERKRHRGHRLSQGCAAPLPVQLLEQTDSSDEEGGAMIPRDDNLDSDEERLRWEAKTLKPAIYTLQEKRAFGTK